MRVAIVGPVFPYHAGIAYCTTKTAEELEKYFEVEVVSFSRQFPKRFYPGKDDRDPSLVAKTPRGARFALDVVNPLTWIREGMRLRRSRPDAVILVWWVWVWAMQYLVLCAFLRRTTKVVLQCHNIGDKEPARWKRWLTDRILNRADALVVHAKSEGEEAARRVRDPQKVVQTFLPIHELGGVTPTREEAKKRLAVSGDCALFFGHVRPFKALDVVLKAWNSVTVPATLLVAGEVWWNDEKLYRGLVEKFKLQDRVRLDFRFIPDDEIATWFAAADVVLAPYRVEAQSGVVLTAFHFDRPVIATTVGGMPEIVENRVNGLLVPPDNPAALAAAITTFFTAANREAMERAVSERKQKYSWPNYGSVLQDVISATVKSQK